MNRLRIRKLGVLSVAKMYAAIMFVMSLIIAIPYGLIIMALGGSMMSGMGRNGAAAGGSAIVLGLGIMIALPIFYAVIGFIGGALGAFLYNIFAGMVGGIEIEVETVS